jgi:hypothetical protein
MKIFFISIILILIFLPIVSSIGISPTRIDLGNVSRGEKYRIYLTVFNTDDEKALYSIDIKKNKEIFHLTPEEFEIAPCENKKIEAVVEIPYDTKNGYYSSMIYVNQMKKFNDKTSVNPAVAVKAGFFVIGENRKLSINSSVLIDDIKNNTKFDSDGISITLSVVLAGLFIYNFDKEKSIFKVFN